MKRDGARRLVYSSGGDGTCDRCGAPAAACRCAATASGPAAPAAPGAPARPRQDGVVRVGRETKGRKGAGVTVVTGAPLDVAGLRALAGELRKACGSGGTLRDGVIEIQGEHRDRIVALLQGRGWTVKRAGG